jgi:hypothetical protein
MRLADSKLKAKKNGQLPTLPRLLLLLLPNTTWIVNAAIKGTDAI